MYIGLCHHGSKGKCLLKHVLVDYCGRFTSESMEMIDCSPRRMQTMPFKGIRKLRAPFLEKFTKVVEVWDEFKWLKDLEGLHQIFNTWE